jgi:electron transfer flavoprotein alpha subunit
VIALVVVRDGVLPLGAQESIDEVGGRAVLAGTGTAEAAAALSQTATELTCWESGAFRPGAWAVALGPLVADERVVLLPASADGRDLAPRLAQVLGRPLLASAIAVAPSCVTLVRGGGLVLEDVDVLEPFVATLQPGSRGIDAPRAGRASVRVETAAVPAAPADPEPLSLRLADPATIELAEAKRILAGGAGLGTPSAMDALGRVAVRLGCALGATRVVADAGWVDPERQIGTTGAVVDPDLYVAVGISGALQHVSGLGRPRDVVAVNLDPSCPMMALADLALVTDAPGFVAALERRLGASPVTADGEASDG